MWIFGILLLIFFFTFKFLLFNYFACFSIVDLSFLFYFQKRFSRFGVLTLTKNVPDFLGLFFYPFFTIYFQIHFLLSTFYFHFRFSRFVKYFLYGLFSVFFFHAHFLKFFFSIVIFYA